MSADRRKRVSNALIPIVLDTITHAMHAMHPCKRNMLNPDRLLTVCVVLETVLIQATGENVKIDMKRNSRQTPPLF